MQQIGLQVGLWKIELKNSQKENEFDGNSKLSFLVSY